jgi:hypothetical protein
MLIVGNTFKKPLYLWTAILRQYLLTFSFRLHLGPPSVQYVYRVLWADLTSDTEPITASSGRDEMFNTH